MSLASKIFFFWDFLSDVTNKWLQTDWLRVASMSLRGRMNQTAND